MHSPVSRRSLLLLGTGGASLSLLSACGLRLDTPPDVPTLDASEKLRNRVARILASTSAEAKDPDTAGEDLQKFQDAIGPEWAPPSEQATEPPASEEPRTYLQAAEVISTLVFKAIGQLGSDLIPVLTDVATGLALTAGTEKSTIISTADALVRDSRESGAEDTGAEDSGEQPTATKTAADSATRTIWNEILNQARAASYGYERLAVNFDTKSPERKGAVARLESLGSLAGEMLEHLGQEEADADAPAWKLDPSPTNAGSARELALNLEDSLAAAVLPWLQTDPAATLRLWESARARTVFSDPQVLRYSYSQNTGEAEAKK